MCVHVVVCVCVWGGGACGSIVCVKSARMIQQLRGKCLSPELNSFAGKANYYDTHFVQTKVFCIAGKHS